MTSEPKNKEVAVRLSNDVSAEKEDPQLDVNDDERVTQLRRSNRLIRPPIKYGFDEFADVAQSTAETQHSAHLVSHITEPRSFEEALNGEHAIHWNEAVAEEMNALCKNNTWEVVELPEKKNTVGCRWLFKIKYNKDGVAERFKPRLVAKGYAQKHGIDYDEIFSPVVRFSSIRMLLAASLKRDMHIHQMDIQTAFLNEHLKEEIYMMQPEGSIQPGQEHWVCELKKSLYGLKQSPKCWNELLHSFLISIGFCQADADPCVYVKEERGLIILVVYVDDLIIALEFKNKLHDVKKYFASQFKMKDMGELHYCLGVTIEQDHANDCIWMHQQQYVAYTGFWIVMDWVRPKCMQHQWTHVLI